MYSHTIVGIVNFNEKKTAHIDTAYVFNTVPSVLFLILHSVTTPIE